MFEEDTVSELNHMVNVTLSFFKKVTPSQCFPCILLKSSLKSVFEKVRFCNVSVWIVDPDGRQKVSFSNISCGRDLKTQIF